MADVPRAPIRLTPNLFAISFGLAGLAECWSTAAELTTIPSGVGDALWVVTAALWVVIGLAYSRNVIRGGRLLTELLDPVFAPFVSLAAIVPMLLGVVLAGHARTAGVVVFACGLIGTVVVGGWLSGQWILSDLTLSQWHPGYFLPTVAGGLLAATGSAQLGYGDLARLMFGYGLVCWVVLGSVILLRLFTQPRLPTPLLPTMAIEVAPPVVAGTAWFTINGGRVDNLALALAGYAALMVLVQVRLVSAYRTVPFGLGWWAFSFSYAAVVVDAVHWLAAEQVSGQLAWTYVAVAVPSLGVLGLVALTVRALARGTFLPRPAPPPA